MNCLGGIAIPIESIIGCCRCCCSRTGEFVRCFLCCGERLLNLCGIGNGDRLRGGVTDRLRGGVTDRLRGGVTDRLRRGDGERTLFLEISRSRDTLYSALSLILVFCNSVRANSIRCEKSEFLTYRARNK